MKLYFFEENDIKSEWRNREVRIYTIDAEEKPKTYELDRKNPYCWASTVKKTDMAVSGYRFFKTAEEAKNGVLDCIVVYEEVERKKAERAQEHADKLNKMFHKIKEQGISVVSEFGAEE